MRANASFTVSQAMMKSGTFSLSPLARIDRIMCHDEPWARTQEPLRATWLAMHQVPHAAATDRRC